MLKVFDFNTWGLTWPFAKDRYERFRALREVIRYSDYDIVVLQVGSQFHLKLGRSVTKFFRC